MRPRDVGDGIQLERDLGNHGQRALRANQQLGEVVAGNVLDHGATRFGGEAVACHVARADHDVAGRAIPLAAWAGCAGREDATERGGLATNAIEQQALAVRGVTGDGCLQGSERRAGLRDERHVARLAIDDACQCGRREDRIAARGGWAPTGLRAAATDDEGEAGLRGGFEQCRDFGRIARGQHRHAVLVRHAVRAKNASELCHYMRSPRPAVSTGCA